ncbi:MAG: hypothetical protein ACI4QE_04215 [Acutalibacteraceae bacterium]
MDKKEIDYSRYIVTPDGKVIEKKQRRFLTAKNLILALACLVILFLCTLAWYYSNHLVSADGIGVVSASPRMGLVVSETEDGEYENEISVTRSFNENNRMKLLSGNGLNFYRALTDKTGEVTNWSQIASNNISSSCYEYDLYFKSDCAMNVYLRNDSSVSPLNTEDEGRQVLGADGNTFSADDIAGAVRVSFLNSSKNQVLRTWIPNKNYELTEGSGSYQYYIWIPQIASTNHDTILKSLKCFPLVKGADGSYSSVVALPATGSNELPFIISTYGSESYEDFGTAFENMVNTGKNDIYIDENRKVRILVNNGGFNLSGYECNNKFKNETEGSYSIKLTLSSDGVTVGASQTNDDTTQEFKGGGYSFTANGTPESDYYYYNGTAKTTLGAYNSESAPGGYITDISDVPEGSVSSGTTNTDDNNNYILTLTDDDSDGIFTGHIVVRMWVEGYDREAKDPMLQGKFNWQLKFQGVDVE